MTALIVKNAWVYYCDGCGKRVRPADGMSSWRSGEHRYQTHTSETCQKLALQAQPEQLPLVFA